MSSKQRGERKKSGSYITYRIINKGKDRNYPHLQLEIRPIGSVTGSLNHLNRYSSKFHSDW